MKFLRRCHQLRPGEAVFSVVTYGEVFYAPQKSRGRHAALERLAELVILLPAVFLPETAAET